MLLQYRQEPQAVHLASHTTRCQGMMILTPATTSFCPNLHSTCHQIIRARVPHRPQRLGRVHQTASRKRDGDTRRHVQRAIKSAFRSDLATKERMPLARLAMMIRWAVSKPHVIPGAYHASQQTERKPGRTSEGSMSMVGGGSFRDSVANGASDQ